MSFGNEFDQSPMDSFLFKKGNQSNFTTPIKENNSNANNNNNDNSHDNDKKATKYDYLEYGNYINRVLSSQFLTDTNEINWNLPRTQDKVNIINAILSIIESKKLYESLLQQSRDTIENIKIEFHTNEIKIKSLTTQNKQLNHKINTIFQRKQYLEIELKKQTNLFKEKNKSFTKEMEQLKYRDKKYQNDIRKKEKIYKQQQEKIKRLLDDRDKKAYKCLGFKLLNNKISTSVLNHPNSKNMQNIPNEQQNRLLTDNNMLQSQIAHLQKQLQSVLDENNLLRQSLLKLEVNCKFSLNKINDLFANNSNNIQTANTYKYAMPFDNDAQVLVNNDIDHSVKHLSKVLDQLKANLDQTNNTQNIQAMKAEMLGLKQEIHQLQQTNTEYESLIRTYVNSET